MAPSEREFQYSAESEEALDRAVELDIELLFLRAEMEGYENAGIGRSYPTKVGARRASSVIKLADPSFLSFTNLVEAHALAAMRQEYQCFRLRRTGGPEGCWGAGLGTGHRELRARRMVLYRLLNILRMPPFSRCHTARASARRAARAAAPLSVTVSRAERSVTATRRSTLLAIEEALSAAENKRRTIGSYEEAPQSDDAVAKGRDDDPKSRVPALHVVEDAKALLGGSGGMPDDVSDRVNFGVVLYLSPNQINYRALRGYAQRLNPRKLLVLRVNRPREVHYRG